MTLSEATLLQGIVGAAGTAEAVAKVMELLARETRNRELAEAAQQAQAELEDAVEWLQMVNREL